MFNTNKSVIVSLLAAIDAPATLVDLLTALPGDIKPKRHLRSLVRRGIVVRKGTGDGATYQLAVGV